MSVLIKLIVTDMDGTLLDDNHQINQEFWNILTTVKEKNINCSAVLVTALKDKLGLR